jgi:hypothetical protein
MFRRQFKDQLIANLYLKEKKNAQITLVQVAKFDSYMEIPSKNECNNFYSFYS